MLLWCIYYMHVGVSWRREGGDEGVAGIVEFGG